MKISQYKWKKEEKWSKQYEQKWYIDTSQTKDKHLIPKNNEKQNAENEKIAMNISQYR